LDDDALLSHLEALAHRLGIDLRYEPLEDEVFSSSGGLCRIKGRYVILLHPRRPSGEKILILAKALRRFDLSHMYLKPAVRELLNGPTDGPGEGRS
jgi:hypothetical protein